MSFASLRNFLSRSGYALLGFLVAAILLAVSATCRRRVHNDLVAAYRRRGQAFVCPLLHAHGACVLMAIRGPGTIMVSRSNDGTIIVPMIWARRGEAVRGSSRKGKRYKGGAQALDVMAAKLQMGVPAFLTVDGPRGPRNRVQMGVADLARRADVDVIPMVAVPSRRILLRSWDRFQVPLPFCRIDVAYGDPLRLMPDEATSAFRLRIEAALSDLERRFDPHEAPAREAA